VLKDSEKDGVGSNGNRIHDYQYGPFGHTVTVNPGPAPDLNFFTFLGKQGIIEDDRGAGLYYVRARYYDSTTGRFITEDPIANSNLYVYGNNNPISNIDPSGELAFALPLAPAISSATAANGVLIVGGATLIASLSENAIDGYTQLITKMESEISRIKEKNSQRPGVVYELRVNRSGYYTNLRGQQEYLNAGDVWKYGETTNPLKRYSDRFLQLLVPGGLRQVNIKAGTQSQIKIKEKQLIYGYFMRNGQLPPGNLIFR